MKQQTVLLIIVSLLSIVGCSQSGNFHHDHSGTPLPWNHRNFDDAEEKLTFAVFSDLTGGEREKIFEVAVAQLNLLRPEMIINVGDLIEGDSQKTDELHNQWDSFDKRANKARAPVFHVGGNHDLTGDVLRQVWRERYGPAYYYFIYKNVLFLVMDTEDNTPERVQEIFKARDEAVAIYKAEGPEAFAKTEYAQMPERSAGTVSTEQSRYFIEAIEANPDVLWTFVFIHKPAWERKDEKNFAAIEAALSDRPYTVFNGHVQAYAYRQRHGRDYIQLATTGGEQFPKLGRAADHVTLVTVDKSGASIANLLMEGILDKTFQIPLGGEKLQFEKASEND